MILAEIPSPIISMNGLIVCGLCEYPLRVVRECGYLGEQEGLRGRGLVRSDLHIEAWWAGAGIDTIEEDNAGVHM
jgi:hypothetical protein